MGGDIAVKQFYQFPCKEQLSLGSCLTKLSKEVVRGTRTKANNIITHYMPTGASLLPQAGDWCLPVLAVCNRGILFDKVMV
jgi:hypothetical protein